MRNKCWIVQSPDVINGGGVIGQANPHDLITVQRSLAIGDVLCASVVADKLANLGVRVCWKSHPAAHCILRRRDSIEIINPAVGHCDVNLDGIYENDKSRRAKHFHKMFVEGANKQLKDRGIDLGSPINCTPRLLVTEKECSTWNNQFAQYERPLTVICPRSQSYACRAVPDNVWSHAAALIPGTKLWIGLHPAPAGVVDLQLRHLDNVIKVLAVTDLLLTTDTGPMHIAAALRIPTLVMNQSSFSDWHLSDQNDFSSLEPEGNLPCLDCQKNLCPINAYIPPCQNFSPEKIAQAASARLAGKVKVSAAVAVYRPTADILNRCLNALLPQVDEIVVCRDLYGRFPEPKLHHDKIRYIVKDLSDIGYGRKMNYCVRHTTGEFVLMCNDDVFLNPDAVGIMMECMKDPQVGLASNLLRYPNGTIHHAGKVRAPRVRGWHHIDQGKFENTFQTVTEMENVCGACNLIRRSAFYSINGFDERFFLCAEDDDMCLSLRAKGWKLMFHPQSTGIHMVSQSTNQTPRFMSIVNDSNRMFGQKWGDYLSWNATRIPGNYDYL